MFNIIRSGCSNQILFSNLRAILALVIVSLSLTLIIGYHFLSINNGISALTDAAHINDQTKEGVHLSYYSSIFSNLSRGLPIDEGVSNAESSSGQIEDEGDNSNPTDQAP